MSKKHFEALAAALNYSKPCKMTRPKGYDERMYAWTNACCVVADTCASFNPNFDRARFLKACGVEV